MEPVEFKGCNAKFAETQDEYLTLPAHRGKDGLVTTCWKLSLVEREQIMKSGYIFLQVLTFNQPLQPLKMLVNNPIGDSDGGTQ